MKLIPEAFTRVASRQVFNARVHSPTILFATGVVGVVGTVVLACRGTLRVEQVLNETRADLSIAHGTTHADYTEGDRQKDIAVIYLQGSAKLARLYGPAFVLGVTSIACLTKSHTILTKRNAGLTAAYAVVAESFDTYRGRVRDEFGEEKDRHLLHGVEEITEKGTKKDGTPKNVKRKIPAGTGMYSRIFNEDNQNWVLTPEYNVMFLRQTQNWANDRLHSRGYLLLNEVYHELGFQDTTEGTVVGWVRDGIDDQADGYVDFGIFDPQSADQFYDFMTGREGAILLDFNVAPVNKHINKINRSGWK